MIAEPEIEQIGHNIWGASLQTVDIDTGIKHKLLSRLGGIAEERQFYILAA
jgi:hypothetical protein